MSGIWRRDLLRLPALLLLLGAIALPAAAKPHPEGTHILVMVMETATRSWVMESGEDGVLGALHASQVTDADIADGSVAVGMIYCCGGRVSRDTAELFYVPPEFRVKRGDVVEVSVGRVVSKKERKRGETGRISRALGVRDAFTEAGDALACRWDPPDDRLWKRVLYCDWMLGEGWENRGGLGRAWYKPPAN